jgi:hypothetical protein
VKSYGGINCLPKFLFPCRHQFFHIKLNFLRTWNLVFPASTVGQLKLRWLYSMRGSGQIGTNLACNRQTKDYNYSLDLILNYRYVKELSVHIFFFFFFFWHQVTRRCGLVVTFAFLGTLLYQGPMEGWRCCTLFPPSVYSWRGCIHYCKETTRPTNLPRALYATCSDNLDGIFHHERSAMFLYLSSRCNLVGCSSLKLSW